MEPKLLRLLFIFLLFINVAASAQGVYNISGTVVDEKGAPMKLATVFISGTKYITGTNDEGRFTFYNLASGNFQVSVQSIGYAPYARNVVVQDKTIELQIKMTIKPVLLSEVNIGGADHFAEYFELFKKSFLGESDNAKDCTILNPRVLNFATQKYFLKADADEFMIIENRRLGYRVRYLLKMFIYNKTTLRTSFDGETSFEELSGTDEEKARWTKNRLDAYKGSLMHFLRAVYNNTVLQEGFLAHQMLYKKVKYGKVLGFDPRPIKFDTVVNVIDTSFISFKFTSWNIEYNPQKAATYDVATIDTSAKTLQLPTTGTVLNLVSKDAIIDSKGTYTDRMFLLQGYWGRKRIGDRLPFEYQPTEITSN